MKKAIAFLLSAALITSLASCGTAQNDKTQSTTESKTASSVSQTQADSAYEEVTIRTYNHEKEEISETFTKMPERVLCYELNSVENMIALGLEDKIVLAMGISADAVLPEYQDGLKEIPDIKNEFISKEDAIALQPDFILAWYSSFDDKRLGDVDFWQERGINTYMAYNSGIGVQNLQNEYDDILNLGKIFHVEEKAEALVSEMKAKVQKAQDYAKTQEPVNIAIIEDEGDVFRVYGEDTIGGDIAVQVGAVLVAKTKNEKKSAEELVDLNPQQIFSVHFGEDSTSLNPENCLDVFKNNPVYQNIDAVKNDQMFPTELSYVYAPGVRVSKSIDFFTEHLYPDLK